MDKGNGKKIFIAVEVPKEKKVNIGTYYLTGETDIWWNTVKDKLVGPEFTWSKFLVIEGKILPSCGSKAIGERVYGAKDDWHHDCDAVRQ